MSFKMSKQFLQEFIHCLKNEPALWQAKSDSYKNKNLRHNSWEKLLKKFKQIDEEATVDTVKKKVNSLRATYRRELYKIKRSEESGAGVDDVYKPSIWYFNELHFLYEQESDVDGINTFDEGPELEIPKATKRKCDEGAELLRKAVSHVDNISAKKTRDDADIFVEGWAVMYRQMSKEQQLFAKKGIDELLMQGQLNMLTYRGVSSINSHSNASKGRNTSSRPIFPYWDELLSKLPEPEATATEVEITNLLFSKGQPYAQTEQPSDY